MPRMLDAAGVVLVGGQSRRFGSPKHDVHIQGETLLERTRRILNEAIGTPALISGSDELPDRRSDTGPLGGIETAFLETTEPFLIVVACDMPGLTAPLLQSLATNPSDADLVVPFVDNRLHPLCARWHRRTLPGITSALDSGNYRVHELLKTLTVTKLTETDLLEIGIDAAKNLWNINRPEDLLRYRQEYSH